MSKLSGSDPIDLILADLPSRQYLGPKFNRAFKDFIVYPENFAEMRDALLRWHPILVTDRAIAAINEFIELARFANSQGDFVSMLNKRRDLLVRVRDKGLPTTLDQLRLEELFESIPANLRREVAATRSKEEAIRLVNNHPETEAFFLEWFAQNDPEWAALVQEIDRIEQRISELTQPHEMPERIALCEQAITLLGSRGRTEKWAQFQGDLANSHAKNSRGRRRDNLDKALQHYMLALEFFDRNRFPIEWAMTHINIGTLFSSRMHEDRVDNVERAIYHHLEGLKVLKKENSPVLWADANYALGNCYMDRNPDEARSKSDIEQALQHYLAAQEVYMETPDATDEDRGMVSIGIGQAYSALNEFID